MSIRLRHSWDRLRYVIKSEKKARPFSQKLIIASTFGASDQNNGSLSSLILGAALIAAALTSHSCNSAQSDVPAKSCSSITASNESPGVTPSLPVYTRAEVAQHTTVKTGVWTTFGSGVYDITGFINNHPGGSDKLVLAAGGRLEHYWNLYRQHYSSPAPRQHLAQMCIGQLHPDDIKANKKGNSDLEDPFALDPELSPVLRCFVRKPVNAEPPGPLLTHSFLTPNDIFFVRNHHPVPRELAAADYKIDEEKYMVNIEIGGDRGNGRENESQAKRVVSLSLSELKNKFPRTEVVATLQCGGNRREELSDIEQTAGVRHGRIHYNCVLYSPSVLQALPGASVQSPPPVGRELCCRMCCAMLVSERP